MEQGHFRICASEYVLRATGSIASLRSYYRFVYETSGGPKLFVGGCFGGKLRIGALAAVSLILVAIYIRY